MNEEPPRPGTPAALERDCTCPIEANNHGEGFDDIGNFMYDIHCELHEGEWS